MLGAVLRVGVVVEGVALVGVVEDGELVGGRVEVHILAVDIEVQQAHRGVGHQVAPVLRGGKGAEGEHEGLALGQRIVLCAGNVRLRAVLILAQVSVAVVHHHHGGARGVLVGVLVGRIGGHKGHVLRPHIAYRVQPVAVGLPVVVDAQCLVRPVEGHRLAVHTQRGQHLGALARGYGLLLVGIDVAEVDAQALPLVVLYVPHSRHQACALDGVVGGGVAQAVVDIAALAVVDREGAHLGRSHRVAAIGTVLGRQYVVGVGHEGVFIDNIAISFLFQKAGVDCQIGIRAVQHHLLAIQVEVFQLGHRCVDTIAFAVLGESDHHHGQHRARVDRHSLCAGNGIAGLIVIHVSIVVVDIGNGVGREGGGRPVAAGQGNVVQIDARGIRPVAAVVAEGYAHRLARIVREVNRALLPLDGGERLAEQFGDKVIHRGFGRGGDVHRVVVVDEVVVDRSHPPAQLGIVALYRHLGRDEPVVGRDLFAYVGVGDHTGASRMGIVVVPLPLLAVGVAVHKGPAVNASLEILRVGHLPHLAVQHKAGQHGQQKG